MHPNSSPVTRRRFLSLSTAAALLGTLRRIPRAFAALVRATPPHLLFTHSPISEPYLPLRGGRFSMPPIAASPDPLFGYRWSNPQATDDLQAYILEPVATFTDTASSFRIFAPGHITIYGAGSIRFDFAVESAAWLEFDSPNLSGSVEMSISEYDEPAIVNTGPSHRFKTAAPHRYGNTFRLELNSQLYEGVRFGWIHVRTFERPWTITAVRAVCQAKPTNYLGSFSCSDPMLTRVWYTGAYSVKVNLCKDYFGALLMDRGDRISWTGDAHPAQSAALIAFGNWEFIRNNLRRSAANNNGIESYSLYWILSLVDYFHHTADHETLAHFIGHTTQLLDHAAAIYSNPPITFYGWDERLGAGFESPNRFETKSAYRMLFLRASLAFADALTAIGHTSEAGAHRQRALAKMQELRRDPHWYQPLGIHALADALNTGLTTPDENTAIFSQAFTNRLNRLSFSPFNQTFILQAMSRLNRFEEAFVTLGDHWGGQIGYGGTTFFETYTPSWNDAVGINGAVPNGQSGYTSLAHAWGAGVTAWLTGEVLGIKPTGPGFSRVAITPHLGATLNSVSGSVPTPQGIISFAFDRGAGRCSAAIPAGVTATIAIPELHDLRNIHLRRRLLWDGTLHPTAEIREASSGGDRLYLHDLPAGSYDLTLVYRNTPSPYTPKPLLYPIPTAREDANTSGNWGGIYGHDGYILFNYDGELRNREQLPPYIVSIQPSTCKPGTAFHAHLAGSITDSRAPAPTAANTGPRNLGQIHTGDPVACDQTMTVDIAAPAAKSYQLALYVLDWNPGNLASPRRQAVELFDLRTLNRLSPVRIVQDFTHGKYIVYTCTGSIRLRINQVRGPNATLNALFFDPPTAAYGGDDLALVLAAAASLA